MHNEIVRCRRHLLEQGLVAVQPGVELLRGLEIECPSTVNGPICVHTINDQIRLRSIGRSWIAECSAQSIIRTMTDVMPRIDNKACRFNPGGVAMSSLQVR